MGTFRGVELADLTLSGPRVDLRRWRSDDAERVYEAMQDPAMRRFLALPDPVTRDAAAGWVARRAADSDTDLYRAVTEKHDGRLVGSVSLRLPGDPGIGYWVAPDARGLGYAGEVVRLVVEWAFALGVLRTRLACDVQNLASARTALAAGFTFEGVSRSAFQGGEGDDAELRGDDARFARLADDPGTPIAPAFPPLPDGDLTDGVIRLRPTAPDDATGFFEDDDEVSLRWSFDGRRRTLADAERRTARAGLDWLVGRSAQLTVVDVATGRYAGDVQVRLDGPPGVAGLGYTVHPDFRGRGFTTRALRLVVPWCFEVVGLTRLELGAKRDNVASQRAAASAGFGPDGVRERRLRNADGTYSDEVCFVLLNPA